jgi:hypothetical protein
MCAVYAKRPLARSTCAGNIVGLAEAFEWRHAADLLDLLFRLAAQEKFRPYRPRCDCVDRNFVSAKLVGEDMDEAFDACLGGDVGAVGGEVLGEDAAGEGDDAATLCDVLRRTNSLKIWAGPVRTRVEALNKDNPNIR